MKNIGIIGCGWLGERISDVLLDAGYNILATTRSEERQEFLSKKGISTSLMEIGSEVSPSFLNKLDAIVLCIPVKSSIGINAFRKTLESIHKSAPTITLLFTSSTSVYQNDQGITDENSKLQVDNLNLLIEEIITNLFPKYLILRLGGLIGDERHPVFHLQGRQNIPNGNAPVNLIHYKDITQVILQLFNTSIHSKTYNVVYPLHPTKAEYYQKMADSYGLKEMTFDSSDRQQKTVISEALINDLNFHFDHSIYPTV